MARRVTWTNNSTDYDGTNVYRDTTIDPQNLPEPIATVGPVAQGEEVEYIDLTGSGNQCYAVRDFDSSGDGALSEAYCFEGPAISASYWRVYITKTRDTGTWEASLAEVEFRSEEGVSENHTGSPLASSTYGGEFSPASAFDGDSGTEWLSAQGASVPQWVGMDMGGLHATEEVLLQAPDSAGGAARAPEDFEIQTSDDGMTWETVKTVTGEPAWSSSETRTYLI